MLIHVPLVNVNVKGLRPIRIKSPRLQQFLDIFWALNMSDCGRGTEVRRTALYPRKYLTSDFSSTKEPGSQDICKIGCEKIYLRLS